MSKHFPQDFPGVEQDQEQGRHWYAAMLPHLDERGRTELSEWLGNQFGQAAS
jgi:hypothetical protein